MGIKKIIGLVLSCVVAVNSQNNLKTEEKRRTQGTITQGASSSDILFDGKPFDFKDSMVLNCANKHPEIYER